jgi:hypothetical protein
MFRFVDCCEDRGSKEALRFWFRVLDVDGDGYIGEHDMKQLYEAVNKSSAAFVVPFPDLLNQIRDMIGVLDPQVWIRGFTGLQLRASKLGAGVVGLLTNHGNMLLQRTTSEWGRGEYPL